MKNGFFSFLLFKSKIRMVFIKQSELGAMADFMVRDSDLDPLKDDLKDHIRKVTSELINQKADVFSAGSSSFLNIPEKFLSATVTGMTESGSLESGVRLARSMLLDVRHTYLINRLGDFSILSEDDVIIISGGHDNSENERMDHFILELSKSEKFKKLRPFVVYAGGSLSAPFAKLNLSPLTDFIQFPNILENSFCPDSITAGEDISKKKTSSIVVSPEQLKIQGTSFSGALQKITEMFCGRYVNKVASVLYTPGYFVINECSRVSGKNQFKRYSAAISDNSLVPDDILNGFRSFYENRDEFRGVSFSENELFKIYKHREIEYYRPDRIVGISLTDNIDLDKFLDLICDPDSLRGIVEFVFDREGVLLASAPMFYDKPGDQSGWLVEVSNSENVVSGWIIIPDGAFVKEKSCLTVYVSGNDERNEMSFYWGKRYVVNVEPYSVIEINVAEKVFLKGKGGKNILKTSGHKRVLVFDLRKEKNR